MFNKNNDTWLKITNMILIVIATISLGIAIGSNYYSENSAGFACGNFQNSYSVSTYTNGDDAKNNYTASCLYSSRIDEYSNRKAMNIAYSLFGTSVAALIICNVMKKNK